MFKYNQILLHQTQNKENRKNFEKKETIIIEPILII